MTGSSSGKDARRNASVAAWLMSASRAGITWVSEGSIADRVPPAEALALTLLPTFTRLGFSRGCVMARWVRTRPGGFSMAQTAAGSIVQPVSIPVVPLRELLPWALFGGLLMLLLIYFVGAEQGATSLIHGRAVHEFVHDGRHLLGFPCH
jgi:hypothetical protein